jgi:hypothetical protein
MADDDPPPEFVAEISARDLAYEAMLRVLMDSFAAMLRPDAQDPARTAAINRAIKMIELQPLEEMDVEVADISRRKAAEKVRDVWSRSFRRDN